MSHDLIKQQDRGERLACQGLQSWAAAAAGSWDQRHDGIGLFMEAFREQARMAWLEANVKAHAPPA